MQRVNVSYSAFGKHSCAHIPSNEDMIKKIKTLQQLLQLFIFSNPPSFILLPKAPLSPPFSRPFTLRTIQNTCWPCGESSFGGIATN